MLSQPTSTKKRKKKKKSPIWLEREEFASTFSMNVLLKKMFILHKNSALKLSGANKQIAKFLFCYRRNDH